MSYHVTCTCGKGIVSANAEGICIHCGRHYQVVWGGGRLQPIKTTFEDALDSDIKLKIQSAKDSVLLQILIMADGEDTHQFYLKPEDFGELAAAIFEASGKRPVKVEKPKVVPLLDQLCVCNIHTTCPLHPIDPVSERIPDRPDPAQS